MAPPPEQDLQTPAPTTTELLEQVLRFGALMLRAGDTAFRVRGLMTTIARDMGFDALSVHFGLGSVGASGQRGGEVAFLLSRRLGEARVALSAPAVIMMLPGVYAFETVVYLKQGDILAGLQAAVLVAFVVTAMALGLAAARFASEPEWLRE